MGLARFAAREAIHAARRASYQQQRQQQRRPVYYRPPVRRPAQKARGFQVFTGIVMTLLVAAAAWGVIAGIAVLCLHLKHQSGQNDLNQLNQSTSAPVWDPAKQEWVTP